MYKYNCKHMLKCYSGSSPFLTYMKNVSLCNGQRWANGWPVGHKNFNLVIFLDTVDVINVKFCMMHSALLIYATFSYFDHISRSQ